MLDWLLALNNLALVYKTGAGVPKDMQKASLLYTRAAELGSADAQWSTTATHITSNTQRKVVLPHRFLFSNLALLHETGQGVPRNPRLAVKSDSSPRTVCLAMC